MASNKDSVLENLENEDTSEHYQNNSAKPKKNISPSEAKDYIDEKWDALSGYVGIKIKAMLKKKKHAKDYESSEKDKHNKLFSLLTKYFFILLFLSLILVLVVAFFKTINFSREIVDHPLRSEEMKEEIGMNFDMDSVDSWESRVVEDIQKNQNNIENVEESIKLQREEFKKSETSIKELIVKNNTQTLISIEKSITGIKSELMSYSDQSAKSISDVLMKEIDKKSSYIPNKPLNGDFMKIPTSIAQIKEAGRDLIDSVTYNEEDNKTASVEEVAETPEEEVKEIIAENDKKIFMSIQIETVDSDVSGYDEQNLSSSDRNTSLPPIVLRQGMTNGVLVTGVSAPTFEQDEHPAPVSLTFKGKSIISNMFEQDVENCTAMGSVFGNIITRRAEILVNRISCTFEQDNKTYMVRANAKGWVYDGYDGRYGIPGILVDSSGSILTDSVIIGMLQGFGDFVSNTAQIYTMQGTSALNVAGGQPVYSPSQVAQQSMVGGMGEQFSSGFDTITEYYQKIIETLYPYIDVKGGRKITIFFDGGETLTPVEYTPFLINKNHDTKTADDFMELEIGNDW